MMEHMPWVVATLMTVLLIGISGLYLTVRLIGAHNVKDDHHEEGTAETPNATELDAGPGRVLAPADAYKRGISRSK